MQLNLSVLRRLEAARRPGLPPTTKASTFLTPGPARRARPGGARTGAWEDGLAGCIRIGGS
jgi:hypothetical protein